MKRISSCQWQTRDGLARALSKAQHRQLVLCWMGQALIIWKQNWAESHWCSNYRETEQERGKPGCGSTEEPRQGQRCCSSQREQLDKACKLLCCSSGSAALPHCSDSLQPHQFQQQQTGLCSLSSWASRHLLTCWYMTSVLSGTTEAKWDLTHSP